jgi:hypothetical protein
MNNPARVEAIRYQHANLLEHEQMILIGRIHNSLLRRIKHEGVVVWPDDLVLDLLQISP